MGVGSMLGFYVGVREDCLLWTAGLGGAGVS